MPEQLPWFPLYAQRLLLSRKASKLSATAFGMYMRLLCYEWIDGILPNDMEELADMAGAENQKEFDKNWPKLKTCFVEKDGGFINVVLEEIREEQIEKHRNAVKWGEEGAEARRRKAKGDH